MSRSAHVARLLFAALALGLIGVCAGIGQAAEPHAATARAGASPAAAHFAQAPRRAVSVRMHQTRIKTTRKVNARRIGRSLATLRPTWVTGSLRFARHQYAQRREVRAWRTVRRIVHHTSPDAQFDVVLNALQYKTPTAIRQTMARLRAKLGPEGWFFDFLSTAHRQHPKVIRTAIQSAHAHGEWIGGNIFGIRKRRPLPARADFVSVQDAGLSLNLKAVKRLSRRHPVLYHLNSDPRKARSGGCRFIRNLNTKRRRAHLRRRAAQGNRIGFRVAYPVHFPQCLRSKPNGNGQVLFSYNAFRDPPMAQEIRRLLDRYEPLPGA